MFGRAIAGAVSSVLPKATSMVKKGLGGRKWFQLRKPGKLDIGMAGAGIAMSAASEPDKPIGAVNNLFMKSRYFGGGQASQF